MIFSHFNLLFVSSDPPKSVNGRSTTRAVITRIYRQSGVSGLFTGLVPRLVKVAPACAIMIASFEIGKQFFYNYNRENIERLKVID
jgi:solute carrier family 25 protein 39/40